MNDRQTDRSAAPGAVAKNRTKSKVRARVEHVIGVIKRVFGFAKVRYRGLKKNTRLPVGADAGIADKPFFGVSFDHNL